MNGLVNILNTFINRNKKLTPTQQEYINTITNGNSSKGEELATNLCNSMGVTKEQAINQARKFFHI